MLFLERGETWLEEEEGGWGKWEDVSVCVCVYGTDG